MNTDKDVGPKGHWGGHNMEVLGNSREEGRGSQETERLRKEPTGQPRYASREAWQVAREACSHGRARSV